MSNSLNEESTSRVLPPLQDLIQHPHSIASTIHDDVLLRIFNFYRLNDEENWNLRFRWRNLAHICRNWRHVILQSPSALDLHLLCKSGIPVANLLAHFPPLLPLVVIYRLWHTSFTDTEDALVALRQSHRVCRVNLQAPSSILHRLLTAMDAPFPKLENLTLLSKTTEDTSLILPRKFLAPTLSKLILQGVALPTTRPLLTFTAIDLVILTLVGLHPSGYFLPENLVPRLQFFPQLEELSIGFSIPIPRPSAEKELLDAPVTRVTLPTLKRLRFRGVGSYLECLVSRINAPLLVEFAVTLFNHLTFTFPHLSQFISTAQELRLPIASVLFKKDTVSISMNHHGEQADECFRFHVRCEPFDWQVDSAARICGALTLMVSAVEELSLDFYEHDLPSEWENVVDSTVWHELLLPFSGVKKLRIGPGLSGELSRALEADGAGLVQGLLPGLEILMAQPRIGQAIPTFMDFVDTRRRAGRSMHVQHGVNMPVSPADVIVNGFIARTFSPEDADRYFMHLLGTPPGQDLLRYHGMLLQRDRWYITCNSHFVRPSLRCVSTQNVLPLLDYHIGIGQGTVLPQRRWIPFDDFENGGPIEGCRLQLPVFFVNRGGGVGFSLPDILQRRDLDLYDANKMVPLVDRVKARLHVDWPDYRPWKCRIFRQDETYARNSISLSHFMRLVGKSVAKFFKECAPDRFTPITQWRIGTGGITQDHVKIIGVIHVSTHNWMPIIQLTHYVF